MLGAIFSVLAALIIFLVLTESISINIEYGERCKVKIGFTFFAILLEANDGKAFQRKRKSKVFRRFLYPLILYALPRTDIKIHHLDLIIPDSYPKVNAVSYGIYSGLISSFIAFLDNRSRFFEASNITILYSEHNKIKKRLAAEINISFLDVIISLVCFITWEIYYRYLQRG